ncbi:actin-related protein 2/3 complex subunit 4, partial [Kipferlia bialata]|eukprot:g7593.t1
MSYNGNPGPVVHQVVLPPVIVSENALPNQIVSADGLYPTPGASVPEDSESQEEKRICAETHDGKISKLTLIAAIVLALVCGVAGGVLGSYLFSGSSSSPSLLVDTVTVGTEEDFSLVELPSSESTLMQPVVVSRSASEKVLIEGSINSVRISLLIKKMDSVDTMLATRFSQFLIHRADQLRILRREPMPGYDLSFLVTSDLVDRLGRTRIINFIM